MESIGDPIRDQAKVLAEKLIDTDGKLQRNKPQLQAYFGRDNSELTSIASLVGYVNDEFRDHDSRIRLKFKMLSKPWQGWVELETYEHIQHKDQTIDKATVDTNFKL